MRTPFRNLPASASTSNGEDILLILLPGTSHDAPRYCSLLFLRRENHDHLAPFHLRHLLDLTDFVEVGAQTL